MFDVLNKTVPQAWLRTRSQACALFRPLALAMALMCSATAQAQTASEAGLAPVRLSGFGTLGLAQTQSEQGWLFAREQTQVGARSKLSASIDSRLGLQANWTPSERWEMVAQIVFRERAHNASALEILDWAFLGFQPSPEWHLRLGRTSPDVFLLADVRNVGYALPWARPNVEFYGWVPFNSMDGADVAYRWQTESADWQAKLALGEGSGTVQVLNADASLPVKARKMWVLSLGRETADLLIKASYVRTEPSLTPSPELMQLQQGLSTLASLPMPTLAAQAQALERDLYGRDLAEYFSLGLQYTGRTWQSTTELSRVKFQTGMSGGWRAYASLGRRWQRLTAYAITGLSRPDREAQLAPGDWQAQLTPVLGPQGAAAAAALGAGAAGAINASRFSQSSLGLGLRYDFPQRVALKLQLDQIKTDPNGSAAWRHGNANAEQAHVLSLVLDFVF